MPALGKDCTIQIGAYVTNAIVRDVDWSWSAKEIEVTPFGQRKTFTVNAGFKNSVTVSFIESVGIEVPLTEGTPVLVQAQGYSDQMVITSVNRSEPLSGVVEYRIELKPTIIP